ncbi:alpha-2-macroglobulin, partial [Caulobacter sp. S45]|uniref:alpha-2-macroglobulin family protein n=1 Tax=Caulobacter sp. S45 TaxID=1641861 RepID=UPI00131E2258
MFGGLKQKAAALAGAALALGFGGGFLAARVLPAPAHTASAPTGFAWPFFGKPRAADAPRAGVPKPDGFTIWTTRIDTSRADPVSCVRLTRPLDPRKSYSDFVLVSPDLGHPVATMVHDDELCVPGLGFAGHQLTLLKGLPAKTGETLVDNMPVDFAGADKPPYVGFDGQGVILPREEADGVGIDTVNVSRLHVEVWRVPDRNLVRKSIATSDPTAEGEYGYEGEVGDDGRVVWKGDVAVKAQGGQRAVTVFPLGAVLKDMQPGAYFITARDASGVLANKAKGDSDDDRPARAHRWILFTDMGLAAYDGSDAFDVVVRSLQTARPMAGVRVALTAKDGETLASASSDVQGHVRFDHALLDGEGAAKAAMVMAYGPNADFTLLDLSRSPLDLSNQLKGVAGRVLPRAKAADGHTAAAAVDGYLYTDRGIYRPGETVHLMTLVRDHLSRAVKDRKGILVIRRPSGTEFRRIRFDTTPDGSLAQDLVLPRTAPRGAWRATLQMDGADDASGEISFEVQDFAPQRLAVSVVGDAARPVIAGEARKLVVNARFLYGAPGSGLQAQTEARIAPDADPFPQFKGFRWGDEQTAFESKLVQLPQTTTDGAGNTSMTLDTAQVADAVQPLSADVTASVLEPGGRPVTEGLTLKLRMRPVYFGVKVTQGSLGEEQTQSYDVIAVDPQGRRVAHPVNYTLISENWTYTWFEENGRWGFHRTSRDSVIVHGAVDVGPGQPARITRRLPWGDYRLVLEDPTTGARTVIRQSSGWGDSAKDEDAPDTARLAVGDTPYASGDTVSLHIDSPFAGEAEVAVASDRVIELKTVSVPAGGTTVRLHAGPEWGGGAYLLVSVMQPRNPSAAPKSRRALGLIYVPLKPKGKILTVALSAPGKLDSRTPITIPLQVKGLAFGAHAHVTVAAVDEGILRLTHQASPDPVKWYFGRRALSVDYRDDYGRLLNPNLGAPAAVNYGGDEVGGAGLGATPIKTVALWSGVVETGADGRATIHLPAGAFNGQLRLMAVAWNDEAVGGGQQSVLVREPVVAELDLPRFMAPGDRADIGLELHNVEGKVGAYVARIFGQGGLLAPFQKLYQLAFGQRILDHIPLTAPNRPGIGAVTLKVNGPGFDTSVSYPLETRFGWSAITRTTLAFQKPGEAFTPTPDLLAGLSPGQLSMTVSYSPFRGFDPAPIAEALQRYPYGCTEQLVSVAYPLLYAQEMSSSAKLQRTPAALLDATIKLLDRQGMDGAFGLWRPGDGEADAWLGAYTVDFLLEARNRGVPVPAEAMDRALHGMRLISQPSSSPSIEYMLEYRSFWGTQAEQMTKRLRSRAAAYALYDLAKAHQGDLPRLRWFHDVQFADEASPLARAQVGAGLAMMGDRARAHDSFVQAVKALGYQEPFDWYQSPLRDLAGVVALAYEAGETGIAHSLQTRLENSVRSPDDLNTQEQARLLQAAHAMLTAAGPIYIDAKGVRPLSGARWAVGRLADARFVNSGRGGLWRT